MATRNVAVLIGSLRQQSYSRKMAHALIALAPASLKPAIVEIGELALYNEDLEASLPAGWTAFRQAVAAAEAVIFVTPEYNRSVPGVLKNAIDVGSRPYGKSVWAHKPALIISNSPGAIGGFGANHHLRQSLVFLDMPALQQPEAYIGSVSKLFGADGKITSDRTRDYLVKILEAFENLIEQMTRT